MYGEIHAPALLSIGRKMYKSQRNYENAQRAIYAGTGEYRIPVIAPENYAGCEWIGFNYINSEPDKEKKGIHFFLDDYQFIRLWTDPDKYMDKLRQFAYVMSPDFSMYTDFPKALQIYNHYRKHWLAAYWQEHGIKVIPTICWSGRESFGWCFDGEPMHSTVAISSVGTQNSTERKRKFLEGYEEMVRRLEPAQIIFYGRVPEECKGNIVRVKAFSEKWNEAEVAQW